VVNQLKAWLMEYKAGNVLTNVDDVDPVDVDPVDEVRVYNAIDDNNVILADRTNDYVYPQPLE
tara:strand:+ start:1078 stop:1266 length:189 start_codon:yes stop_codon:yes gene_type:complete